MTQVVHRMTVEEFQVHAAAHGRCELIDGEVRLMSPAGGSHGEIGARLLGILYAHVTGMRLGKLYTAETGFVLDADAPRVRAPDVAFIAAARAAQADTPKFIPIPPDLVAEVLSPDDRASEVNAKVQDWLRFGVRLVWVVDPQTRTVAVHAADGTVQVLHGGDTLTGDPAVAGFRVPVAELFG